jgi:hypothetical protein
MSLLVLDLQKTQVTDISICHGWSYIRISSHGSLLSGSLESAGHTRVRARARFGMVRVRVRFKVETLNISIYLQRLMRSDVVNRCFILGCFILSDLVLFHRSCLSNSSTAFPTLQINMKKTAHLGFYGATSDKFDMESTLTTKKRK